VDFQQISVIAGLIILIVLPGLWLYRDAERRNRNGLLWAAVYGFAAIPPTRLRFILIPAVFLAWFLIRDQQFRWFTRLKRILAALFDMSRRR
jgi:hypothetical protein